VEIASQSVAANGWVFDLRCAGPRDGRPILLLHGFPQTSRCFDAIISALGQLGYWVVAPDQRGYSPGARPMDVARYGIDHLVADVTAIADGLDIERFDLVGHDWGGLVAWTVAGSAPNRVRSLTAVSTPHPEALADALNGGDPDQATRSAYLEFFRRADLPEAALLGEEGLGSGLSQLFADAGIDTEQAEAYVAALTPPGALTAALNWYRANDLHQPGVVGPITMPTLYVWSTNDLALGRLAAESTAGQVAGPYRFVVLEGVSHWIPDVAADQLLPLLASHLADASEE
jgi:pimeloyl-ACP methyl ester carboxylesterase